MKDRPSNRVILRALRKLVRLPSGLPNDNKSEDLLATLWRLDLVDHQKDGGWKVSDAGKAWLRREMSGSDPWLTQHRDLGEAIVEIDGKRCKVAINLEESPLSWLRKRKGSGGKPLLDDAQFAAGERLRTDFTRAQLTPRVTADWSAMARTQTGHNGGAGGGVELLDSVVAARQRFNKAIEKVGPELSPALIDICCFLKGLEIAERENNWPKRSAKLVLQIALSSLARHYGLSASPKSQHRQVSRIRRWGASDYRPEIDPEL